jgi:hypothetical protein
MVTLALPTAVTVPLNGRAGGAAGAVDELLPGAAGAVDELPPDEVLPDEL